MRDTDPYEAWYRRRWVLPAAVVVGLLLGLAPAFLFAGIVLVLRGRRVLGGALVGVGVALLAATVTLLVTTRPYRIPSAAMTPTLAVGDRILATRGGGGSVGDIVVFYPPTGAGVDLRCGARVPRGAMCSRPVPGIDRSTKFVKRIVAGPGDTVTLRRGHVLRNGRRVAEPYVTDCDTDCDFPRAIRVPPHHVFVLGDNRGSSADSRFWGPVPETAIIGHAVFRYWPLSRFGTP